MTVVQLLLLFLLSSSSSNSAVNLVAALSASPSPSLESDSTFPRRHFLAHTAGAASSGLLFLCDDAASASAPPPVTVDPALAGVTSLRQAPYRPKGIGVSSWQPPAAVSPLAKNRLLATELMPLQQSPFSTSTELYYPNFLFGAWQVTATLRRKIYPYGPEYLPSPSLLEGSPRYREEQVGDSTTYEAHYFSALEGKEQKPKTQTVNLSNASPTATSAKIIQDRAFNAKTLSVAYKQLTPVQDVIWDYQGGAVNANKLQIDYGTGLLTEDLMPLGPKRTEIFVTARAAQAVENNNDNDYYYYATAERSRSVTLVTRDAVVSDVESITEFVKPKGNDDNVVTAWNRIAVYLTPNPNSREGLLWQQTGGQAVAFFDYELVMKRIPSSLSSDGNNSLCIMTPKGVLQCAA